MKGLLDLRGTLICKFKFVIFVVFQNTVSTDELVACEAVNLQPFLVLLAPHWLGLDDGEVLLSVSPHFLDAHHSVTRKHLHPAMTLSTEIADVLRAMATEGHGLVGMAQLTHQVATGYRSLDLLHTVVERLQAIYEKGGGESVGACGGQERVSSTFWAGEGLFSSG